MNGSDPRPRLFLWGLLPWIYLVTAAALCPALRGQPAIVRSNSTQDFTRELRTVGGSDAVRVGIGLDTVFVLTFAAAALWLLGSSALRWMAPVAALCDLAENSLLWALAGGSPSAESLQALRTIAVVKLVAYALTIALLIRAWVRTRRRVGNRLDDRLD